MRLTQQHVEEGELLAETDDARYFALPVVYRLNGSGDAAFYCTVEEWTQTEVGRVATLYAEIARLRARVLELESKPEDVLGIVVTARSADMPAPKAWLPCPHCGKEMKNRAGLSSHIRIVHGE